jgi:hypothetical protein
MATEAAMDVSLNVNPKHGRMDASTIGARGSSFLAAVRRYPLLEQEQEYMLAKNWREHHEHRAAHQLVTSHLRLVVKSSADANAWETYPNCPSRWGSDSRTDSSSSTTMTLGPCIIATLNCFLSTRRAIVARPHAAAPNRPPPTSRDYVGTEPTATQTPLDRRPGSTHRQWKRAQPSSHVSPPGLTIHRALVLVPVIFHSPSPEKRR